MKILIIGVFSVVTLLTDVCSYELMVAFKLSTIKL